MTCVWATGSGQAPPCVCMSCCLRMRPWFIGLQHPSGCQNDDPHFRRGGVRVWIALPGFRQSSGPSSWLLSGLLRSPTLAWVG
eukprot:6485215-Amphidinium_carterae.1